MLLQGHPVLNLIWIMTVVFDAHGRDADLTVARGQPFELSLFPRGERVVVTLGTIDPLTEERSSGATGEFIGIDHPVIHSRRNEVHFGTIGPQTPSRNHVTHDRVVGTIGMNLIAEPGPESITSEHQKLPLVSSYEDARNRFAR